MKVIQNATALALNSQSSRGGDAVPKSDSESSTNKHLALEIAYKDPSNRECADCKTPGMKGSNDNDDEDDNDNMMVMAVVMVM